MLDQLKAESSNRTKWKLIATIQKGKILLILTITTATNVILNSILNQCQQTLLTKAEKKYPEKKFFKTSHSYLNSFNIKSK